MKHTLLTFLMIATTLVAFAQTPGANDQQEIIYGRRDGMALTMTKLSPTQPNGKAIVALLSGGWTSSERWADSYTNRAMPFVKSGYTVFLIMHASAPRYAIPDAFEDVQRAIQYIRYNANTYRIDPDHIGITGTSSGGHLSLLAATVNDIKDPGSKDPVERVSSRVQAAAVFAPPTDLLNFGQTGYQVSRQRELLQNMGLLSPFQYTYYDTITHMYTPVPEKQRRAIDSSLSPVTHVSKDDPPVYIMHGDQDDVVPLQQSQLMLGKLQAAGVPASLVIKPGAKHGWKGMNEDEQAFIVWFDKWLVVKK